MGKHEFRTIARGELGSTDPLLAKLRFLARQNFISKMSISDAAASPVLERSLERWGVGETDTAYIKGIITQSSVVMEQLGIATLTNLRQTLSDNPNLLQENKEIGSRGVNVLNILFRSGEIMIGNRR